MLDAKELARRITRAIDEADPPVTSAAIATECKVTAQAVNGWRKTGRVSKRYLPKIAAMTGTNPLYFLDESISDKDSRAAPAQPALLSARQDMMLLLFNGLFSHQQRELIVKMQALFHANEITRKELGHRPLRGVSDGQIEAAFGNVPPPGKKKPKPAPPGRDPSAAMDDYPEG